MGLVHTGRIVSGICAVVMVSSLCFADPPGPNVLPVEVTRIRTDRSDEQADALTAVLRSEVAKLPGWSLAPGDFSFDLLSLDLNCSRVPDRACLERMAVEKLHTNHFVWGSIEKSGDKATGVLHLWQKDRDENSVNLSYSAALTDPASPELQAIVRAALLTLTGGRPMGSVDVTAGNVTGDVYVDGELVGKLTNGAGVIPVPVGDHVLEVRAPGFSTVSQEVTVLLNDRVPVILYPVAEHGSAAAPSTPLNFRRIGAYGALGVGAALAAGGLYYSLDTNKMRNDDGFKAYTNGVASGTNVCQHAADRHVATPQAGVPATPQQVDDWCQRASKNLVMQWVLYGLGAASVGVGTYLLVTDKPAHKDSGTTATRLELMPTAIPGANGVDVRVTF